MKYDIAKIKEIAKELGTDWKPVIKPEYEKWFDIQHKSGAQLGFYVDDYRKKLEIRVSAPHRPHYSGTRSTSISDFSHLGQENKEWTEKINNFEHSISSGLETAPKTIASGITRRILAGGYLDFYQKCVEYRDRENARTERKYKAVEKLAKKGNGKSKENKFETGYKYDAPYVSDGYVSDFKDDDNYKVSMKLDNLNFEQAETIMKLIGKWNV